MQPHEVATQARGFARDLNDLLNRTVCNGPRLAVLPIGAARVRVGYGIDSFDLSAKPIPLHRCLSRSGLYLVLSYTLSADEHGEHLMVTSSTLGLCLDAEGREGLFHADYEREKADGYPESHLQVYADSEQWTALMQGTNEGRALGKLHLPAGGRRYRPSLEDMIEFLMAERLVEQRDGWAEAVAEHRARFEEKQLRAAVRRYPHVARDELRASTQT